MAYCDFLLILTVGFSLSSATKLKKSHGHGHDADESGSGYNTDADDVDFLGVSGDLIPTTLCRRQEIEASARQQPDAFVAKCNDAGEFEPRQCHHKECWCVNRYGHEISGTKDHEFISSNCLNIDKSTTATVTLKEMKQTPKGYQPPKATTSSSSSSSTLHAAANLKPDDVIIDETKGTKHHKNKIDQMSFVDTVDIGLANSDSNELEASMLERKATSTPLRAPLHNQPGLLAGIIGGTTLALLCIVLFVMFLVYRMRKKDEGSYALDEPKNTASTGLKKPHDREFFA